MGFWRFEEIQSRKRFAPRSQQKFLKLTERHAAYGRTAPDSIITTQRNGQTIVVELFFNHSSTETFRNKFLKLVLADSSRLSASDGQEPGKTPEKCSYCVTWAQKGEFMRTGLTKQEKTTDIWFDKKDPLIHIRTHNTDLKRRLAAYAKQVPWRVLQDRHRPRNRLHGV